MFLKAPDGFIDGVRFIYDPDQIGQSVDPNDPFAVCTSVILPNRTKREVDRFFGEFLGFGRRKVSFSLDKTYGEIILAAHKHWHSQGGQRVWIEPQIIANVGSAPGRPDFVRPETCSLEECPCKFSEDNFWLHFTFHRLLEKIGNYVDHTKKELIGNFQTLIQKPTWDYLKNYEYPEGQNDSVLPDFEGSVEFVLKSLIANFTDNFKFGEGPILDINKHLLDESVFDDCEKGKHDYIHRKTEWESKSVSGNPMSADHPASSGTSRAGRRWSDVGTSIGNFEQPLARIERVECSCSRRHYVFELNSYPATGRRNLIGRSEPDSDSREAIEHLFFKYFELVLPRAQAEVASKLFYSIRWELKNAPLESRERQAKKLLRNNLDRFSATVMQWPDLRDLYQKLKGAG